jgi:superfamily II DNA or RNA helicase
MLAKTLRDDQALAIYQIRESVSRGERRIVVQGPTGMGKGLLIADIVDRALLKNKRVLITVPAISLVDQTVVVLSQQGVRDVGVIQAQHPMTDWSRPVQVASVQTLTNRWKDGQMPRADVVLVDEVHRWFTLFPKWMCDIAWQDVPFVGFSATPWTKGLGAIYGRLIVANTIDKLIAQGVLVPFRTFAPDVPDLSGVSVVAGDFVAAEVEEIMRPKKLVANIVDTWLQLANGRPTVCFCCSRAHADQVAKEFEARGVGAGYMDCETLPADRAAVRKRMLDGQVQVVTNVEIVGIGVDWPEVSCIIYARPTMSDMRFVQNVGRGLRAAQGKTDLLILDHSTTTMRLGMVDEVYALHKALDDGKTKPPAKVGVLLPKPCEACGYLKAPRTATCPNCGHVMERHAKPVPVQRGTLREIKAETERAELLRKLPDKAHVYGQLLWWADKKGYKQGWASVKYKEIFGIWPRGLGHEDKIDMPVPALLEHIYRSTEKWKRSQDYAKRNARKEVVRTNGNTRPERNATPSSDHGNGSAAALVPGTLMTEEDMEDFR